MSRVSREEYSAIRQQETENKKMYYSGGGRALAPHTICLSVNNNCYMRCKMCDIGMANQDRKNNISKGYFSERYAKNEKYAEFPVERLKELVDEFRGSDITFKTNFVEPLIYKPLHEIAAYIKDAGLKYYTITNGWLLKKNAQWLVDVQANLVRVSLDGSESVHDNIRGKKGSFKRTIEGIEEIIVQKQKKNSVLPILGLCFTVSNYNYFNIVDYMEALDKTGILKEAYVNFNHLQYTTQWEVDETLKQEPSFKHLHTCSVDNIDFSRIDIPVLQDQIQTIYRKYDQADYHYYFSPQLGLEDLSHYYDPDYWMFKGTPCFLPWYSAQIDITGDVGIYGHCVFPAIGNIFKASFRDVWNSRVAVSLRNSLKAAGSYPACNRCIGTLYPLRGRN